MKQSLTDHLHASIKHLEDGDPRYFAELLPSNQHWRLFPEFQHTLAYLDIETTGLGGPGDVITTIALYDGTAIFSYIRGENLHDFKKDIRNYKVLVTYNGKCFDVPFIENHLRIKVDHVHVDLRYVLASLGYKGGLKGCERQLGLTREGLEDVDGFFAVLLWEDFNKRKNHKALETLLAYNIQDVVSLETLMVIAYNKKLEGTPFSQSCRLPLPVLPEIPFGADRETIARIKGMYITSIFEGYYDIWEGRW